MPQPQLDRHPRAQSLVARKHAHHRHALERGGFPRGLFTDADDPGHAVPEGRIAFDLRRARGFDFSKATEVFEP